MKFLFSLFLALALLQAWPAKAQDNAASAKGSIERKALLGGWLGNNAREFFSEEGPKTDFEIDFLDSGDCQSLLTSYDSYLIIETRIHGKWRLEGDKLIVRGDSLVDLKLSLDEETRPSKEKKKELTQQLPKLQAELTKKMQEELAQPKELVSAVLSLDKGILVTKDAQAEIYVYQKK